MGMTWPLGAIVCGLLLMAFVVVGGVLAFALWRRG